MERINCLNYLCNSLGFFSLATGKVKNVLIFRLYPTPMETKPLDGTQQNQYILIVSSLVVMVTFMYELDQANACLDICPDIIPVEFF